MAFGACLQLALYDRDQGEICGIRYGVEFVDTYALQTHARKPLAERLRDPAVIEEAIQEIVGPLVTRARRAPLPPESD